MGLGTKIRLSYLLGALLTLGCAAAGLFGITLLSGHLTYLTGPAWESSDACMEAQIGLQRQMLAIQQILTGRSTAAARERLAAAREMTERSVRRVEAAGVMEKGWLTNLQDKVARFDSRRDALLQAEETRRLRAGDPTTERRLEDAERAYQAVATELQSFLDDLEDVGDGAVEGVMDKVKQSQRLAFLAMGVALVTSLVLAGLAGTFLPQAIIRPVAAVMSVLEAVAAGDLSRRAEVVALDEVGRMAIALNSAVHALRTAAEEREANERRLAEQARQDRWRLERELDREKELAQERAERERAERERLAEQQRREWERRQLEASQEEVKEEGEQERRKAQLLHAQAAALLITVDAAAEGDLTQPVLVTGDDPLGHVGRGLDTLLTQLGHSLAAIDQCSENLSHASDALAQVSTDLKGNAEETAAQAGVLSVASREVSGSVKTVASSVEEMGASIREIASSAAEASRAARSAVAAAESANTTMAKLGESSARIGKVIKFINSIAEQTNLLALNATIEAARAGEAGKGFAIVANEVKELAKETAKATGEIRKEIEAIQADSKGAVEAIQQITTVIAQVDGLSTTIAGAVEEQTATTNEMNRNIAEAARGTEEITQNMASVAQSAKGTHRAATTTFDAATELAQLAGDLRRMVSHFRYHPPGPGDVPVGRPGDKAAFHDPESVIMA